MRSSKKGPFVDQYLITKARRMKGANSSIIKTWSRRSMIIPEFVGLNFSVHNGRKFIPVHVTEEMVGYKLGSFAPTRIYYGHAGDKKIKKG